MPAAAGNAAPGGGASLHLQRPAATGAPRGEDVERELPQGKAASLASRRSRQVQGYVGGLQKLKREALAFALPGRTP